MTTTAHESQNLRPEPARRSRLRTGAVSALLAAVTVAPVCASAATASASASTHRLTARQSAATAWKAAHVASRQVGKRYVYGGAGPSVFDCSGLVQYSYRSVGVRIPRTADQQYRASRHISRAALRPGDVIFFHDKRGYVYHDAIYAGYGAVWNAPHTGARVRVQPLWTSAVYYGRFI